MVARLGVAAKLGFKAHPHMFRHACGFQLANQGTDTRTLQAYLGHRNIQHTVRYTELSPTASRTSGATDADCPNSAKKVVGNRAEGFRTAFGLRS
jgi:integrase